jgi:hypothetical protein
MINVILDKDNYFQVISDALKVLYKEKLLSEFKEIILEDISITETKEYLDMMNELKRLEDYGPTTLGLFPYCNHDGFAHLFINAPIGSWIPSDYFLIGINGIIHDDGIKDKFDISLSGKLNLLNDIFSYANLQCVYTEVDIISIPIKEIRESLSIND